MNDDFIQKTNQNIANSLEEYKELYDYSRNKMIKIYRRSNMDTGFLNDDPKLWRRCVLPLGYVWKLEPVCLEEEDIIEEDDISPSVDKILQEALSCCVKRQSSFLFSIPYGKGQLADKYNIKAKGITIENVQSLEALGGHYLLAPQVRSMTEVLERIAERFPRIKVTKKAFQTCKHREGVYRQYGYDRILCLFQTADRQLFPFILGEVKKTSEENEFAAFKKETGIKVSRETPETMQKYGSERDAKLEDGTILRMEIHFKIMDARIYCKAYNGYIYLGHSGEHLRIASE